MESNLPVIQSNAWYVAKDTAFAAEYEDAFSVQLQGGRAAIADGVSSAIFSGRWARILTRKAVDDPPDLSQPDAWVNWLAEPRRLWLEDIDFPRMPANQKQKLRQVGGSFCTLCWIEFHPIPGADDEAPRCLARSFALGDSCLLHIRSGELLRSFPLTTSEEFDLDPDSICSVATSRDGRQPLASIEFGCLEGDTIVLVTDAIAKWMLTCIETGIAAPWEQLWCLDEAEWAAAIERLRETNIMKRDDTTMIVLNVGEGIPPWSLPVAIVDQDAQALLAEASSVEEQAPDELEFVENPESEPIVVFWESVDDDNSISVVEGVIDDRAESSFESVHDVTAIVISENVSSEIDDNGGPAGNAMNDVLPEKQG